MDVGVATLGPRSIILCIMNFGVINILGLDPSKAKMGDIAIKASYKVLRLGPKFGWRDVMAVELEVLFNFKKKLTFPTSIPLIIPILSRDSILHNGYI